MTIINPQTKKAATMRQTATNNLGDSLNAVYGRYSTMKAAALQWCRELCHGESGYNFRIISANTFGFSVAWETADGLRIETKDHSYFIPYV